MKQKKPNFIVAGAAKAGSTSLYYYLGQHPQISFPKLKEPKYFTYSINNEPHNGPGDYSVDKYAVKSWDKYQSLFKNLNTKFIGDASPDYLYYSKLISKQIRNELGDIPIVIILRNPIMRAFSAFTYLRRDNRENLSFRKAINEEKNRISKNFDFIWHYKSCGLYMSQIKHFEKSFTNIKIIFFDDLVENPLKTTNSVIEFLNLKKITTLNTTAYNPSGIPNTWYSKFLLNRRSKISLYTREALKMVMPRQMLERVAKTSLSKMHISEEDFLYLKEYFSDEIKSLENHLNRDLSHWTKWQRH